MMRFLVDCNVGRLARWLRALGYDAAYEPALGDAELVRRALAEDRILLTRDRDLMKRRPIATGQLRALFIEDDGVLAQVQQAARHFGLGLRPVLDRCLECNATLEARSSAEVAARVPPYVRATQSRYRECPLCGRIYWAGTHWMRMHEALAALA
jgi:uncharacterized protein with PIN domain